MLEGAVLTGGVELAGAVEPSMEDLEGTCSVSCPGLEHPVIARAAVVVRTTKYGDRRLAFISSYTIDPLDR